MTDTYTAIDVPKVHHAVQYGPDPLNDRISPDQHHLLSKFLLRLIASSEERRRDQIAHMIATETDLLGIVEPTGSDCERKEKREAGEDVSVPDAIYPFGYLELQKFASEIMAVAMPVEAPYAVVTDSKSQERANAIVQILRGQATQFDHRNNIHGAVFDAIALNLGAVRFEETVKRRGTSQPVSGATEIVGPDDIKGLQIVQMDPYNITRDYSVSLPKLPTDGEFVAEFDICTGFHVRRGRDKEHYLHPEIVQRMYEVSNVDDNGAEWSSYKADHYDGVRSALEYNANWYYMEPRIAKTRADVLARWGSNRAGAETDFSNLFSGATHHEGYATSPRRYLQKIRMFVRIRPHEYGLGPKLNKDEKASAPFEMWEFILYGPGYIGYAQPAKGAFDELPVAMCNMNFKRSLGRSVKFGEHAAQMGLLASTLMNMHKRALRKGLEGGLTIYNPDVADLTKLSETAGGRVPVHMQRYDDDLRRHFMQLNDLPDTSHTPQHAQAVNEMLAGSFPANSTPAMAGLDRATTYQAQAVTMTSQRSLLYYATLVDAGLLVPCRNNLMYAILSNPQELTYVDEQKGQLVQLAAEDITSTMFQLVQSQPLMGIDRLRSETIIRDMVNVTLQSGGQLPPVAAFMLRHYAQIAGIVIDIGEYEAAVAQEQAQFQQQQEAAADGATTAPEAPAQPTLGAAQR